MATYIDGFVIPIKKDRIADYQVLAEKARDVWMEYGALSYVESVLDDNDCAKEVVSFPKLASAAEDETVVFAFITYRSREHRDEVNAKVMADPRMQDPGENVPFDCARMTYGGFRAIVEN